MQLDALTPTTLWKLLGFPGGPVRCGGHSVLRAEARDAHVEEEIELVGAHGRIPGTFLRPDGPGPHPAVLYCHAHGNRHDIGRSELTQGRPALKPGPYGPLLAARGFAVLCVDMPGFGDRQAEGTESALAKAALWRGTTLFGAMLADLSAALDWLCGRDDIDAARIASLGISMGATHAYWLAALDRRIAAAAHLCAFSDIAPLIETGAHDLHGIYMTVPGLLAGGDMGDVAALVAPRPQLVGAGGTDPLTPPAALAPALTRLRAAYEAKGAARSLQIIISPDTGHMETDTMRAAVLAFLDRVADV